ncbi:Uncharacterized protein FWK35_00028290 [Aphis craccivora]|uniref:Uncharacterized protein n=1 Tax=Aphis craccivora TaxID=307492 RepID=A0A6G0WB37_APHCR|nr:Uncharacterized protein FWK35_00028290 [Aphis craccivora]
MCENNYNAIIDNLQTRCKRVRLTDNLSYSVNVKQSSTILHSNENYITLSHIDLHRLKQLQHCIDRAGCRRGLRGRDDPSLIKPHF